MRRGEKRRKRALSAVRLIPRPSMTVSMIPSFCDLKIAALLGNVLKNSYLQTARELLNKKIAPRLLPTESIRTRSVLYSYCYLDTGNTRGLLCVLSGVENA